MRTFMTAIVAAMLMSVPGARLAAQTTSASQQAEEAEPTLHDLAATQAFQRRVTEYVVLHRLLEMSVPPLQISRDIASVHQSTRALRMRIQQARINATEGELFTPEMARVVRRAIAAALNSDEWQCVFDDMMRDEQDDPLDPPVLFVNMEWPERVPYDPVPPQLLRSLPPLPEELQYRIIGRSLVLWDHHANLIVDILPGAFAVGT